LKYEATGTSRKPSTEAFATFSLVSYMGKIQSVPYDNDFGSYGKIRVAVHTSSLSTDVTRARADNSTFVPLAIAMVALNRANRFAQTTRCTEAHLSKEVGPGASPHVLVRFALKLGLRGSIMMANPGVRTLHPWL